MRKAFLAAFVLTALMVTGCASPIKEQLASSANRPGASEKSGAKGRSAYRIRLLGSTLAIRDDAIKTATGFCQEQDKEFVFLKNVIRRRTSFGFETIHYDLYFTCGEEGVPAAVAVPTRPGEKPSEAVTGAEKPATETAPPAQVEKEEEKAPPAVKQAAPSEKETAQPSAEEKAPPAPAEAPKKAATPAPPPAKPAVAEAPAGPKSIDISNSAGSPESLGFQEPAKSKKLGVYGPGIVIEEVIIK